MASAQTSSASTEVWDGSSFRRSLPLPTPMEFHCQVSLNDTHVFISDVYSSLGTYILDWNDGDPEQYVQVRKGLQLLKYKNARRQATKHC